MMRWIVGLVRSSRSSSCFLWISWDTARAKWKAHCRIAGVYVWLGRHETLRAALLSVVRFKASRLFKDLRDRFR